MRKQPKSVMISARITAKAEEKWNTDAATAGFNRSRYLEQLILQKDVVVIGGLDKFIPALKSSGKNLHQILVRLNTGQIFTPNVVEVHRLYGEICDRLTELAGGEKPSP